MGARRERLPDPYSRFRRVVGFTGLSVAVITLATFLALRDARGPIVFVASVLVGTLPFIAYIRFVHRPLATLITGPLMVVALVGAAIYALTVESDYEMEGLFLFMGPWVALLVGGVVDDVERLILWLRGLIRRP